MRYFIFITVALLFFSSLGRAERLEESIPYKLAFLHTKALNPESVLLNKKLTPDSATLTEFQWLLQGLKNRCINPETAIADTIMETWQQIQKRKGRITLLELTRDLSQTAHNTTLFETAKVNFRMTTSYWLAKQYSNKIKDKK